MKTYKVISPLTHSQAVSVATKLRHQGFFARVSLKHNTDEAKVLVFPKTYQFEFWRKYSDIYGAFNASRKEPFFS